MCSLSPSPLSLHAAASQVIHKGLELLKEQCADSSCAPDTNTAAAAAAAESPDAVAATAPEASTAPEPLISLEPVDRQGGAPRSALTAAFGLLRQSSREMAQEAAAVGAQLAAAMAAEHEAALATYCLR